MGHRSRILILRPVWLNRTLEVPPLQPYASVLFWFRRDLRLDDNAGLYHALCSGKRVFCAFVFDREILDGLPSADRRVEFIWESVIELGDALRAAGGELLVLHARASEAIPALAERLGVEAVFANGDYEPAARARDTAVEMALATGKRRLHLSKDQALFERDEVLTQSGRPFMVFTPYRNAWSRMLDDLHLQSHPVMTRVASLARAPFVHAPPASLESLGFQRTNLAEFAVGTGASGARRLLDDFATRIDDYARARDFPGVKGASYLSVHNRFGTISIRELARMAKARGGEGATTWLSELCWRDFYFQVLWHHPRVALGAFRREFEAIAWPNDERLLRAWREGRTGYPLVDAGMRQLNQTGFMHNRLRMVTASFLAKDLLVDWRLGEAYFALHLNDFDQAANNGGWQWAASTGCDAQPYFRIFNPVTQSQRFDPHGHFIRRYVPELAKVPEARVHAPWMMSVGEQTESRCRIGRDYPAPVVDHATQRVKALALYGVRAATVPR
jgi:deoxyribodipyrimidine photo-lyase